MSESLINGPSAAELALREREERLRAIVDNAVDAIITIDCHGLIESANPAAVRLFGYTMSEMVGSNVSMLMPEPHRSRHNEYLRHYLETGVAAIIGIGRDVTAVRKNGSLFSIHLAISEVKLPGRTLFTAIVHDLTNRRRLELLVLEAASREQKRIGQDLHDGVGQHLAGLSFFCKSLVDRLAAKGLPEADDARRMSELITQTHEQVRGLSHGLNPVINTPHGLTLALRELADFVTSTFSTPCTFESTIPVMVNDENTATQVYRIAQEAVTNAMKHARPWNITIRLDQVDDRNILTVQDDGRGISRCPFTTRGGIGLEIMKSRASLIQGTLDVLSPDVGGTAIRCIFPVELHQTASTQGRTP